MERTTFSGLGYKVIAEFLPWDNDRIEIRMTLDDGTTLLYVPRVPDVCYVAQARWRFMAALHGCAYFEVDDKTGEEE